MYYKYIKYKYKYLKGGTPTPINLAIMGRSFGDHVRDLILLDEQNIDKTILDFIVEQDKQFKVLNPNINEIFFIDAKEEDKSDFSDLFKKCITPLENEDIEKYIDKLLNENSHYIYERLDSIYENTSSLKISFKTKNDNFSKYISIIKSYILTNKEIFDTRLKIKILLKELLREIHMRNLRYEQMDELHDKVGMLTDLESDIDKANNILKKYTNLSKKITNDNIEESIFTNNIKIVIFDYSTMSDFDSKIIEIILNHSIIYTPECIEEHSLTNILRYKDNGEPIEIEYLNNMIIKDNDFYKTLFNYIMYLISKNESIDISIIPDVVIGNKYDILLNDTSGYRKIKEFTFEDLLKIKKIPKSGEMSETQILGKSSKNIYIFNSDVFNIRKIVRKILRLPEIRPGKYKVKDFYKIEKIL